MTVWTIVTNFRGDPRHPEHQPPVEARAATCHAEYETSLRTAAERSSPGDSAEAVTEAEARAQRLAKSDTAPQRHLWAGHPTGGGSLGRAQRSFQATAAKHRGAAGRRPRRRHRRHPQRRMATCPTSRSPSPKPTLNASARSSTTRATTSTQTQRRLARGVLGARFSTIWAQFPPRTQGEIWHNLGVGGAQ